MKTYSYKFRIHPITPFHIGNGEEHDPLSLVIKGSKAYFLNPLAYIRYLLKEDAETLNRNLTISDIKLIHKYFRDAFKPEEANNYLFSYPVHPAIADDYNRKMDNLQSEGFIHAFIRSQLSMQPYIPGSSLKGAFRTAVLSNYCTGDTMPNDRDLDRADRSKQAKLLKYWKTDERNGREYPDIPGDPFKFLKFADTPWSNDWIGIYKVGVENPPAIAAPRGNPFAPGFKPALKPIKEPSIPILMELGLSKTGRVLDSDLTIAITDPANKGISLILPAGASDIKQLVSMVKRYYQCQFEKEQGFYQRMGDKALTNYTAIQSMFSNLKDNECMIKLGMGSGQNYCSYAVMNHSPKTRKMVNYLPLGWMKLSFEL